jgi:ATP-binding cassette subfamily B protein
LQDLGSIILSYREVEASVNNFDQLMQKPVERRPENPVEFGDLESIRFENVVFQHKTATFNAIDGISFRAGTGETIAFAGPSGSGKTTLVKLLVGLYRPLLGKIYFNEHESSGIRYNQLRRQIGFVTQDTQLFSGTIKENLLFVKSDATEEEILDALKKASCEQLLRRTPLGIGTVLGEGGMKLSGGEKQRISIARALLRHPRLLIFDEATSALDSLTEEDITIQSGVSRKAGTDHHTHRPSFVNHHACRCDLCARKGKNYRDRLCTRTVVTKGSITPASADW